MSTEADLVIRVTHESTENRLRDIFVNAARRDPAVAMAIFVDCSKSHEGIIPFERMEALYQESLDTASKTKA